MAMSTDSYILNSKVHNQYIATEVVANQFTALTHTVTQVYSKYTFAGNEESNSYYMSYDTTMT